MTGISDNALAPEDDAPDVASLPAPKGRRQSLAKVPRELNSEEWTSPAVQKLLMDEIDRLQTETDDLKNYQTRFHAADKEASRLVERLTKDKTVDILFAVALAIGSALFGLIPSIGVASAAGKLIVLFAAILIFGAMLARFRK